MANPFQDALTESIDYLVRNRINKLDRDKTITATIVGCNNALTQEYKVNYNNGYITAWAAEGASYRSNQMVYVLVPEGDFTKKLMILGPASTTAGDNNITFVSSLLNNYNTIGDNVLTDDEKVYPLGLHSYLVEDYQLIYDRDLINDENAKMLHVNVDKLNNYMRDAEAVLIEGTFQTRLPREHRLAKTGIYGVQFVLAFKDQSVEYNPEDASTIKHVSYVLDTNNMTGNPMVYNNETDQYAIFPVDAENFLYIESILAFSRDFVSVSDANRAKLWGPDIFVKDLEFYGLREVSATNGEYSLKISTPRGATFKTISAEETLEVYGRTMYQFNEELSDYTSYYWFQKDDRVTSSSKGYHMYGGAGWKWLEDKGNNKHLITSGVENRAYENKYMCVAVYKENLVLKDYFTLYNEACKRDIEIVSDLGLKFSFDRGAPNLTCLINGNSENFDETELRPDDYYAFSWSKLNYDGSISSFTQSKEELEAELEELMSNPEATNYYASIVNLKNKIYEVEGVTFDRNHLTYPVKNIENYATFSCSVFMKDTADGEFYFIGSATITLLNETAASPNDYHIVIVNGEQVFQYSESGVSPASKRYVDPLEIKDLSCKFYDPAGLEVDPKTYSVTWVVPLESTLIVKPTEGLVVNPATGLQEYYPYPDYKLNIADNFDYQALLNQINCIVDYNGQQYTKYTDLMFVKVGDNGTNGTDFVAKVDEVNPLNNEPLTLYYDNAGNAVFNDGSRVGALDYGDKALEFELYNRNTLVSDISTVNWSIAGRSTYAKYIDVSDGRIKWDINKQISKNAVTNLIIKGETTYQSQKYYAFYPLPIVNYLEADVRALSAAEKIHFDDQKLIKQVLYNADGHNPLYNKNQGIAFNIGDGTGSGYTVVLTAMGGVKDNSTTTPLTLTADRENDEGEKTVTLNPANGYCFCYVDADLIYDGAYCNNRVHGEVSKNGELFCTFDVPIHFTLNRYGLASLNAWDGNHIEINDDENYILAPQIGAGIKEPGNGFTGVVMGTASTYDQTQYGNEVPVGLLGYSNGEQSIALDARTGNAIFGLPEQMGTASNRYDEGRIELIPGGVSKVGNWKIGSRFLYNTVPPTDPSLEPVNPPAFDRDNVKPIDDRGLSVDGAKVFIPQHRAGVLMSSDPPYLSIKSRDLVGGKDFIIDNANRQLNNGESIEVEIDPSKMSVFTVYRHYTQGNAWHRTPMVGINTNGEFYTNALQYADAAFSLGFLGAFGKAAGSYAYLGSKLDYDSQSIAKFFIEYYSGDSLTVRNTRPLHITGTSSLSNEYIRPIHIHGNNVSLYASNSSTEKTTRNYISISASEGYIGVDNSSYLKLRTDSTPSSLTIARDFSGDYNGAVTTDVASTYTGTIAKDTKLTINANATVDVTGAVDVNKFTQLTLARISDQKLTIDSSGIVLNAGNSVGLNLYGNSNSTLNTNAHDFTITTSNNSSRISMSATQVKIEHDYNKSGGSGINGTYLTLGSEKFILSGTCGSVRDDKDSKGYKVVQINPKLLLNDTGPDYSIEAVNGIYAGVNGGASLFGGELTANGHINAKQHLNVGWNLTVGWDIACKGGNGLNVENGSADVKIGSRSLRTHYDAWYNDTKVNPHNLNDADRRITTAQETADSKCTMAQVEAKGYLTSLPAHSHDGYATTGALADLRQSVIDHGATINAHGTKISNLEGRVSRLEAK